jgi:hypothetical protein
MFDVLNFFFFNVIYIYIYYSLRSLRAGFVFAFSVMEIGGDVTSHIL